MDVTPLRTAIFQSGELQIVIAKRASIHETRLSKIARGHVAATADEKERLAGVLGVTVADLFPEAVAS